MTSKAAGWPTLALADYHVPKHHQVICLAAVYPPAHSATSQFHQNWKFMNVKEAQTCHSHQSRGQREDVEILLVWQNKWFCDVRLVGWLSWISTFCHGTVRLIHCLPLSIHAWFYYGSLIKYDAMYDLGIVVTAYSTWSYLVNALVEKHSHRPCIHISTRQFSAMNGKKFNSVAN